MEVDFVKFKVRVHVCHGGHIVDDNQFASRP